MNYVVSFDLDGTLINSKNEIIGGVETISILKQLQLHGVKLMLNTGRLDHDVYHIIDKYDLDINTRISQNGAVIYSENSVTAKLINKEDAVKVYDILKNFNSRIELNTVSNRYWLSDRDPDFPKEYYDSSIIVSSYEDIIKYQPVVLFLVIGESEELDLIKKEVESKVSGIEAVKTSNSSLEILAKSVNKGNTIRNIYKDYYIISIGDSENDFSSFEVSNESYYVGNGKAPTTVNKCKDILEALTEIKMKLITE